MKGGGNLRSGFAATQTLSETNVFAKRKIKSSSSTGLHIFVPRQTAAAPTGEKKWCRDSTPRSVGRDRQQHARRSDVGLQRDIAGERRKRVGRGLLHRGPQRNATERQRRHGARAAGAAPGRAEGQAHGVILRKSLILTALRGKKEELPPWPGWFGGLLGCKSLLRLID